MARVRRGVQERRRYGGKNTEARVELFSGGRGTGVQMVTATRVPTGGTELPDIETQEGLKQLQRKDQQIDEALDQVAEGVSELKNIALDMRDEVKIQSSMVDEITSKVRPEALSPAPPLAPSAPVRASARALRESRRAAEF